MSIQTYDVKTSDYNIVYYSSYTINKLKSLLTYSFGGNVEGQKILDNIYLGSISSVYDVEELKKIGITHVVSVIAGFEPPYPDDFKYLVLHALDTGNTDLQEYFEVSNEYIENAIENDGKVLIHCMAGRSRSATILAAYIIKKFGINVEETIKSIKNQRDIVEPNPNFLIQLKDYYKKLYNEEEDEEDKEKIIQ